MNDATAVIWRRLPYMLSPQLDIYEKLAPIIDRRIVLEIGFGTGIGVLQYAGRAKWVDAIELDAAAVRFAKRCLPQENVNWIHSSLEDIKSFPYGAIVMIEVLEHIPDPKAALQKVSELLDEGGKAIISVPNNLRGRRKKEILNEQEWTPESFRLALKEHFFFVDILNYDLSPMDEDSRETPIVGLCW